MKRKKPITRWNVLALIAAILGTVATLGLDHWWMHRWINSGVMVPVGTRATVPLEPGRVLAYYESNEAVPLPGMAAIHVIDPSGNALPVMPSYDMSDYSIDRHEWSGRLLWEFQAREAGLYDIGGFNHHYHSDDDIPSNDRIVIARTPELLAEAVTVRNTIRGVGVAGTLLLVGALYVPHVRTVRRSSGRDMLAHVESTTNRAAGNGEPPSTPPEPSA